MISETKSVRFAGPGLAGMMALFGATGAQDLPMPEGRRLRDIIADRFPSGNVYMGGTTGWKKRPRGSGIVLDREFSYVTPENDFKHSRINPSPGVWEWETSDTWVEHCATHKQVLRMHCPIGPQVSRWAKEDHRTAAELEESMTDFLTRLCRRYDRHDHVKWMDVVNETVTPKGSWFGPKPGVDEWENPWPKIGYDNHPPLNPPKYIRLAFETATKYAPNTKLVLNQHGGMQQKPWSKIKTLVHFLRDRGLRVDGIGWQAHIDQGFEKKPGNMKRLGALIDWAHENDLSFHVTENNVWLKGKKDYDAQAATFGTILKTLLERRDTGVVTWNVWNLSDGDAYAPRKEFDGSIFFADFRPKPAYYALQKLLENPPETEK